MVIQTGIQVGIYFLPVGVFIALVLAAAILLLLIPALVVQLTVFSRRGTSGDDSDAEANVFAELSETV